MHLSRATTMMVSWDIRLLLCSTLTDRGEDRDIKSGKLAPGDGIRPVADLFDQSVGHSGVAVGPRT